MMHGPSNFKFINVWDIWLPFEVYMDLVWEEMKNGGICVSFVQ